MAQGQTHGDVRKPQQKRGSFSPKKIVIAGGGLAGLTCAKELVERGHHVSIYEGQPFLGGRASTFKDEDGDWIEQGLHIFLGAYTEFRKLLSDIQARPTTCSTG